MAAAPLRVVYVAASSHSGSTLLALLANQHPLVASVGETAVKPRIRREGRAASQQCSCGARLDTCDFWSRVFRRVTEEAAPLDASHWSNDYRFEHPWLDRLLTQETSVAALRRLRYWAAAHVPGYRSRFRRIDAVNVALVRAVLAETGAQVFVDTTKLLTRLTYLLAIENLDVKVVWMTRDVRGIGWSAHRRGASMLEAARTWRTDQEGVQRLLASLPPNRNLHVRYEDLCSDPRATLGRFWEFCGVDFVDTPATLDARAHHVLGNSMRVGGSLEIRLDERWRREMAEASQRRLLGLAGALHAELGHG